MVFPQFSSIFHIINDNRDSKDPALRSLSVREQIALHFARCVANEHSAHLNTLGVAVQYVKIVHLTEMAIEPADLYSVKC